MPAIINEHHVIEPHGVPKRRSPLLHNAYKAPIITIANLFVLELYIQRQEKQSPHTKNSSLTLFITYEVWSTAFGKEFGSLAQGDNKNGEKGTNFLYVMSPEDIRKIPKDRVITYGRIVVNYSPQKDDPNRVRITAGGDKMKGTFDGEISTRAADLTTSKVMWNSVLSTKYAKYMTIDIKNIFPTAPLEKTEYMKMPVSVSPQHVMDQYDLDALAVNDFVYLEMR